jgi:predicted Zn-dependent protease
MLSQMDNSEKAEYLVGIEWIHTRPLSEAIKERGFFGNQNTVCQPTSKRWDFTISRLKQPFGVKD